MLCQSGGFLGLFADAHLAATELEGGPPVPVMLESASALERLLAPGSLRDVLAPPGGAAAAEPLLRRLRDALREGADIESRPHGEAVRAALRAASTLLPGEYATLYAGWTDPNGCLLYTSPSPRD